MVPEGIPAQGMQLRLCPGGFYGKGSLLTPIPPFHRGKGTGEREQEL